MNLIGKYLHIVEDGDIAVPCSMLQSIIVNTAQSGAVIKAFDGDRVICIVDGGTVRQIEFNCGVPDGLIIAPSGFSTCDVTVVTALV